MPEFGHPCPHGMPTPASCITCMEDGNVAVTRVEPEAVEYDFTAKFVSECPECDGAIHPGDPMVKTTRGRSLCAGCDPT